MVPLPLRRGHGRRLGLDALVVLGDLLRPGVVGAEALPDRRGGQAADGELLRAIQEFAAVDVAVDILVEQVEQLLRVIGRFLSFHRKLRTTVFLIRHLREISGAQDISSL